APTNAPAANSPNAAASSNANAATNAPKSSLEGIVSASVERVEMSAGETAETSVRLSIKEGYHVNANPATEKFLIPTALSVKPEAGFTVDNIAYPKPLKKKFPFAGVPLDIYEGDAVIKLKLRAPRDLKAGQHALRADLRVQPCDDQTCFPPMTIATNIEVTIR
ncbi:MAG TPA: protein-disulfide reductase DsbD domain-containing protein, partial [Pyrinomonadaceae bacterium]